MQIEKTTNAYLISFLIFGGSIFGITYFLPAFIFKYKSKGIRSYEKNNLAFLFSRAKLSSFSGKSGLITILCLIALVAFNFGFMSVRFYELDKTGSPLYDLELEHVQDYGNAVDMPDFDAGVSMLLSKKIGIVSEAVVSEYYDNHSKILENLLNKKAGLPMQRVILLSEYNQLRAMQKLPPLSLDSNQFILNIDSTSVRDNMTSLENKEYPIFDKLYKPKATVVLRIKAVDSRYCIVVADSEKPKISPKRRKHFWNLKSVDEAVLQKALIEICYELNRPVTQIKTNGEIIEIPDREFQTKANKIMDFNIMAAAFITASFYIGIIILISAASILASTAASEIAVNTYRYGILIKLGIEKRDLHKLIQKQVSLFFFSP